MNWLDAVGSGASSYTPSEDDGIGNHAYCRSPNGRGPPFCFRADRIGAQKRGANGKTMEPCNVPVCKADTRNVQREARAVATYVGSHDCLCASQLFGSTTTTADTSVAGTSGGGVGLLQAHRSQVRKQEVVKLTPANVG